jgi:hypothetical protein
MMSDASETPEQPRTDEKSASEATEQPRAEEKPASETPEQPPTEETSRAQAEAPAAGAGEAEDQAEHAQPLPLHALETKDILIWCLGLLAAKAWEGMGLVPNPGSGKVAKDLDGARLAIDAYAAVFVLVREGIDASPRREMETLLTNLRLNFVEKSGS